MIESFAIAVRYSCWCDRMYCEKLSSYFMCMFLGLDSVAIAQYPAYTIAFMRSVSLDYRTVSTDLLQMHRAHRIEAKSKSFIAHYLIH